MQTDECLIDKARRLYEEKTGWGDSAGWTNQDFLILSEKIQDATGVAISHVTLKRLWGKVKYDSLPNTHTLDTLVQYLGYDSWREFKSKNANCVPARGNVADESLKPEATESPASAVIRRKVKIPVKPMLITSAAIMVAVLIMYIKWWDPTVKKNDYSFSSKKIVAVGVPNSVVFNYDASKSPYDSVVIQQSWDAKRQVKVSKWQHQHTSIYYLPEYYQAKLIVGGKIVAMHHLLIRSDGWLPVVMQDPVPVYFNRSDAIHDGKLSLTAGQIKAKNIAMEPKPPTIVYSNVSDLGEIYTDNFTFETSVKNDYHEGAAACQNITIYILCEGTAIGIPLSSKGCVSNLNLLFTGYFASGKQEDLSAFGVDFSFYTKLRIECKNRKALIYINDQPVYTINKDIYRSKIVGFDYVFEGTGSIDYVKLNNGKVNYQDDFDR